MLRGHKVATGIRLIVAPASIQDQEQRLLNLAQGGNGNEIDRVKSAMFMPNPDRRFSQMNNGMVNGLAGRADNDNLQIKGGFENGGGLQMAASHYFPARGNNDFGLLGASMKKKIKGGSDDDRLDLDEQ